MVTFTKAQQVRACQAVADVERGDTDRADINALLYGAARSICDDGQISDPDRVRKWRAMVELFGDDPSRARFVGGTRRAGLAEDMTEQLSKIDNELRAQIHAVAQLAYEQAAERVAVKLRHKARRSCLNSIEEWSLDHDPAVVFVSKVRANVRRRLFAELTVDEEETVKAELATAAGLVEELLEEASDAVRAAVPSDSDSIAESHTEARPRAVGLFLTALTTIVLSRLDRVSGIDDGEANPVVPWSFVDDTLAAAGGAATTDDGRLVVNADSRIVTPDGETAKGSRFAQGAITTAALENDGLVAVVVFRHSGSDGGNPIHVEADGKPLTETEARAGTTPGCRCSHETIYEEAP